eukprot:gene19047-biopygen16020
MDGAGSAEHATPDTRSLAACGRRRGSSQSPRPARPGPAGLAWPGLWRGTQAVAQKAPQLGCREAALKAPRLAQKAPPSAPKYPQNTRKCPGHAQCVHE